MELNGEAGNITAIGGPPPVGQDWRTCIWRLSPRTERTSVLFAFKLSNFAGPDHMTLLDDNANVLSVLSRRHRMPQWVEVRGDAIAVVLASTSVTTRIEISYVCSSEVAPFVVIVGLELSLPQFVILAGVIFLLLFFILVLLQFAVGHLQINAEQERNMQQSQVLPYAEHIQSLSEVLAREQLVQGRLHALPQGTFQEQAGTLEECCLCLESFLPDDTLRILPCKHYFHKECADSWFKSRLFRERRCPLCNANPAARRRFSASQSFSRSLSTTRSVFSGLRVTAAPQVGDGARADADTALDAPDATDGHRTPPEIITSSSLAERPSEEAGTMAGSLNVEEV